MNIEVSQNVRTQLKNCWQITKRSENFDLFCTLLKRQYFFIMFFNSMQTYSHIVKLLVYLTHKL